MELQSSTIALLKALSTQKSMSLFIALQTAQRWSELLPEVEQDSKALSNGISNFIELKLIESKLSFAETNKGVKVYELTPLGHQVLEKLVEIDELFTKSKESESRMRYVGKEEVD